MQDEQNHPQSSQHQNSSGTERKSLSEREEGTNKIKTYLKKNKSEAEALIEMFLKLNMLIKQFERQEKFSSIFYEIANKLANALDELRETQGIEEIEEIQQKKVALIMEVLSKFLNQQKRSLKYKKDPLTEQEHFLDNHPEDTEFNNPDQIKNYFENLFLGKNDIWTEEEKEQLISKMVASVIVEADNTVQNLKKRFIRIFQFEKLGERVNKNLRGIFFLRKSNKTQEQLVPEIVARLMREESSTPQNSKEESRYAHIYFRELRKDFEKKIKGLFFIFQNNTDKKQQKQQATEGVDAGEDDGRCTDHTPRQ